MARAFAGAPGLVLRRPLPLPGRGGSGRRAAALLVAAAMCPFVSRNTTRIRGSFAAAYALQLLVFIVWFNMAWIAPMVFGTQIKCAQCHDHPLAHEIKQGHYWAMVAAFNRSKKSANWGSSWKTR